MKRLRIFVVDDDRDFAESVAEALESHGHDVATAHSGEEAVRKFRAESFDVTLMDVQLPGMNGVESLLEIRRMKPAARIVMMTAYSVEQLLEQAVDQGALGVLHKPFDLAELRRAIESARPAGVVLVVDDDPEFVASVERYLGDHGFTVLAARSGEEAVAKVLANGVDLLVLDLRLPILDGLEVYLELKKRGRALPTVLVTGYALEEQERLDTLSRVSGAGCLVKPFDPKDLLAALNDLVERES